MLRDLQRLPNRPSSCVQRSVRQSVSCVLWEKVLRVISIKDRRDFSRTHVNEIIERRHVLMCEDNRESCQPNLFFSDFHDANHDSTPQIIVLEIEAVDH